jgi:hypothetical protein
MNKTTINEKNNFSTWAVEIVNEMKSAVTQMNLGDLLFENDLFKLWTLTLEPNERIPFSIFNTFTPLIF